MSRSPALGVPGSKEGHTGCQGCAVTTGTAAAHATRSQAAPRRLSHSPSPEHLWGSMTPTSPTCHPRTWLLPAGVPCPAPSTHQPGRSAQERNTLTSFLLNPPQDVSSPDRNGILHQDLYCPELWPQPASFCSGLSLHPVLVSCPQALSSCPVLVPCPCAHMPTCPPTRPVLGSLCPPWDRPLLLTTQRPPPCSEPPEKALAGPLCQFSSQPSDARRRIPCPLQDEWCRPCEGPHSLRAWLGLAVTCPARGGATTRG